MVVAKILVIKKVNTIYFFRFGKSVITAVPTIANTQGGNLEWLSAYAKKISLVIFTYRT